MSLLFIAPDRDMRPWKEALLQEDPDLDIEIWPDVADEKRVQFAVTWQQPQHVTERYPNLQAISSLGAGIDHILQDETIADDLAVCRVVSPSLVQQMKEYIFNAVLTYQRDIFTYRQQMQRGEWIEHTSKPTQEIPLGIMGLGALGKPIARELSRFGYDVFGWARTPKEIDGVKSFVGLKELPDFLSNIKIVICLLPLTNETAGILDLELFKRIKQPGYLINVARGAHLIEEDLIYALDKEWMDGAFLDVFMDEPLPEMHPFWNRPSITITPHISSITRPEEVATQIIDNYKRALSGMKLQHVADRGRGY